MKFPWRSGKPPIEAERAAAPETPTRQQPLDLAEVSRRLESMETTLARMWHDIDFLRNRTSCYLGDGTALTHLVDQTPMFVNSNDFGSPLNLIDGGRYEEENLAVLFSFVTPDTIFIDVGANVGFFAIQIGRRLNGSGKVYAFEPHPKLAELLQRNAYANGLQSAVKCYPFALSDRNAPANLHYPIGHLGGGRISPPGQVPGHTTVTSEMKRLDDVLGADFSCDLVKIDVEGHEMRVLRGMEKIVQNSPKIKILFEKLVKNVGNETNIEKYFFEKGMGLYGVGSDASLQELGPGALRDWAGYVLATKRGTIDDEMSRSRFSIFARQLWTRFEIERNVPADKLCCAASRGALMFHGPYWFLKRGRWRLKLHGRIRGAVAFSIMERFGYAVSQFTLEAGQSEHEFVLRRDLVHFECAARAASKTAEIEVESLAFMRIG